MTLTRRAFIAAAASTAVAPTAAVAPAATATPWTLVLGDDLWSRAMLEESGQWPPQRLYRPEMGQIARFTFVQDAQRGVAWK